MAAIKFHGAIDVEISRNPIYRVNLGVWLDWMAQGTRVSANFFHHNRRDLFVEVVHGPFLVDNNVFLSPLTLDLNSQGGAFVHNLVAGVSGVNHSDGRKTPFHKAHSTEIAGMSNNQGGDDRFYNNIFVEREDLSPYDSARLPVWMDGNVFLKGAKPSKHEKNPIVKPSYDRDGPLAEGRSLCEHARVVLRTGSHLSGLRRVVPPLGSGPILAGRVPVREAL